MGPDKLIGRSTHQLEQLHQAQEDGADYLGVGPVYATATKADRTPAGLDWVRTAEHSARVPWFAIGGIHSNNISEVLNAGASRVAVVSAIMGSDDPTAVSRELLRRLG